jgi:hypothetical protein
MIAAGARAAELPTGSPVGVSASKKVGAGS